MGDTKELMRSHYVETTGVSHYSEDVPMNATFERDRMDRTSNLIHSFRMVAAGALAGAVLSGLTLGWIPALSAMSVEEIGGLVGAGLGILASIKHIA